MKYNLTNHEFDNVDKENITELFDSTMLTMGKENQSFENELNNFFSTKYAVTCNSGSSANLLMIASLFYSGHIKEGDEIIVPAVSWSTTYAPLSQFKLKIKFVDVDIETYNLSLDILRDAVSEKTKAVFFVSLLGNSIGLPEIKQYCDENNLILLEDNCESFGTRIENKYSGSFGLCSSLSFFYSHQLPAIEGGAVLTNSRKLYDYLLCLRSHGWTRELVDDTYLPIEEDEFKRQFRFSLPGYNLRMMEISAKIASRRLDLWTETYKVRSKNFEIFKKVFSESKIFNIQRVGEHSSLFGFGAILSKNISRLELYKYLMKNNIESRPVVAGNFTKNNALKYMNYEIYGNLDNSDVIDDHGIFFGNCNKDLSSEIYYLKEKLDEYK